MTKETQRQQELDYVIIRPFELKDQRKLISLLQEAWEGAYPGLWRSSGYLIAENQNRLVGAVHCWQQGERLKLEDLAVKPVHRQQGIAAALIEQAEVMGAQIGVKRLAIEASNQSLAEYYERLGFIRLKPGSKKLTKVIRNNLT